MAVSSKSQILKTPPKIKTYRNYKTFDENRFNEDLKSKLDSIEKRLKIIFIDVLNTYAPATTKKVRANNHQFMTKTLRKAIMTRSRLKNAYLKTRNSKNWEKYQETMKFLHKLTQKIKSDYFRYLNIKDLTENKTF